MRIITNDRYDYLLNKIKALRAENKHLKEENDEQAQEIYGLREDLASLKWNLNKYDPQLIDFPNSANYQLADYETDFPGENPEDIF